MYLRNAGETIRQVRISCGMTQEKFSEGICEVSSLSRIESGCTGVSPAMFQCLMERGGIPSSTYPEFQSKKEFQAFRSLQNIAYSLNSWKFNDAMDELKIIGRQNYGNNSTYYGLHLIYLSELMLKSGYSDYNKIECNLTSAIQNLAPNLSYNGLSGIYLNIHSIHALILLAECCLYLGDLEKSNTLADNISSYLEKSSFSSEEKISLAGKNAVVRIKLLIAKKSWQEVISTCQDFCYQLQQNHLYTSLPEIFFLWSLADIETNDKESFAIHFDTAFFSSDIFKNGYSNRILEYCSSHFSTLVFPPDKYPFEKPGEFYSRLFLHLEQEPIPFYAACRQNENNYLLGEILRDLRKEKGVTQSQLCLGLCSKSKLSKIESNQLNPDCFLLEALLQRLGVQSNLFCTFSSKPECDIYELRRMINNAIKTDKNSDVQNCMDTLLTQLPKKDVLNQQWFLYTKYAHKSSSATLIADLYNVLFMTIPHFNFTNILDFYFTYNELTIIQNIASSLSNTPESLQESIYVHRQLLNYFQKLTPDNYIFTKNQSPVITRYIGALYRSKNYGELDRTYQYYAPCFGIQDSRQYARLLFYYCQSLFELHKTSEGLLASRSAVAACRIIGYENDIPLLKKYLWEDFNISI